MEPLSLVSAAPRSVATALGMALLVGLAACHKADVTPPDPAAASRDVPVAPLAVASVAPTSSVAILPLAGLAATSQEDTAAEVAELQGDDPQSPRCVGVRLVLAKVADGRGTSLVATLFNDGPKPVTLVEPGDGSDVGWRTPVITWSVKTPDGKVVAPPGGGRCGNVNPIKDDEIFTLAPHAKHVLGAWLGQPPAPPGHYVVAVTYDNDPQRELSGLALGQSSKTALARIKTSTTCKARSNALIVDL